MSYHIVITEGNLAADVVIRNMPSGDPVAFFRVLVNEEYPGSGGERIKHVEGYKCVLRGKRWVESLQPYLKKGKHVIVESKKRTREYKDNGVTKYVEEFVVQDIRLLGARQREAPEQDSSASAGQSMPEHDGGIPTDPNRIPF